MFNLNKYLAHAGFGLLSAYILMAPAPAVSATPVCDPGSQTCVGCLPSSDDCPSGKYCDADKKSCSVTCGERTTDLKILPDGEAKTLLSTATFFPSPIERAPYALARAGRVRILTIPESGAEKIDLNLCDADGGRCGPQAMSSPFTADPRVRHAMLAGIDREQIVRTIARGQTAVPPDSWISLGEEFIRDPRVPTTAYDPAAANHDAAPSACLAPFGDAIRKAGSQRTQNSLLRVDREASHHRLAKDFNEDTAPAEHDDRTEDVVPLDPDY